MSSFEPKRVLFIQLKRIGDVLLCTPAIKALKKSLPDTYLAFLTESESAALLKNNPYLDELIVWDSNRYSNPAFLAKSVRNIRQGNFDAVVDFQGSPRTALFAFFTGAKMRLGFDYRHRSIFYTLKVTRDTRPKYGTAFKLDLLGPLGISSPELKPEIFLTDHDRSRAKKFCLEKNLDSHPLKVVVSPVSRRAYKRWPESHFARLCSWLKNDFNAQIILTWGPGEKDVVERVASMSDCGAIISEPTHSLLDLAALLENCDLYVGNDNGIKHIATAVNISTFTIYGPSDPVSWTYPDPVDHRFIKGNCKCGGARQKSCQGPACLTALSTAEIQKQLVPFLREIISRKAHLRLAQA